MTDHTRSEILAEWIAGLRLEDIPDDARIATEDTVTDTVGLTVAALETDYGQAVRRAFAGTGGCTVWGLEGGAEAGAAAVINGTAGMARITTTRSRAARFIRAWWWCRRCLPRPS